jgi:hypothetical protein
MKAIKYFTFTLSIIFVLSNKECLADISVYEVNKIKFSIDKPGNWQMAPDFLGSDLTLLGPFKNDRRPIITFSSIPLGDYHFDSDDLKKNEANYHSGRISWLKKNKGTPIDFYSYKKLNWSSIKNIHGIGYKYKIGKNTFEEMSYFFKCRSKIFNISTLISENQQKENKFKIESILNSLTCLSKK